MALERKPRSVMAVGSVVLGAASLLVGFALSSCESGGGAVRPRTTASSSRPSPSGPDELGSPVVVAGVASEPEIRVRILDAATTAEFTTPSGGGTTTGGIWLSPVIGSGARGVTERTAAQLLKPPVHVSLTNDMWVISDNGGFNKRIPTTGPTARELDLDASAPGSTAGVPSMSVNGVRYSGRFRLAPSTGSKPTADVTMASPGASPSNPVAVVPKTGGFDVIEYVPLETYLPGVLAKELPKEWPLSAFKVQAVCARSYAIHERNRSASTGKPFDVESTTRDQAYAGAAAHPTALEAVRQTRGVLLEHNGNVLRSYYSSTCGGRTAAARDTWPTTRGFEFNLAEPIQAYPREAACDTSPLYRWRVERPKDELARRFALFGQRNNYLIREIRDIAKIEAVRLNETGRPIEFRVTEPGGKWYTLKGEEIRLACNTDDPASAGRPGALPPITRQTRVNSSDFDAVVEGSSVVITGRGFGHGVGMCQFCTRAMSVRGDRWQDILHRFYPGARIVRAY